MYPKVKVRGLEHDDVYDRHYHQANRTALLGLKAFHSLFEGDFGAPGPTLFKTDSLATEETKEVAPQLVAKVPSGYTPASSLTPDDPKGGTQESEKEGKEEDHHMRHHHIRASPIPRPRAVLSSPVNDELIGSKTKSKVERNSKLKGNSSSGQSRYCKSKVIPRPHLADQSPTNRRDDGVKTNCDKGRKLHVRPWE